MSLPNIETEEEFATWILEHSGRTRAYKDVWCHQCEEYTDTQEIEFNNWVKTLYQRFPKLVRVTVVAKFVDMKYYNVYFGNVLVIRDIVLDY